MPTRTHPNQWWSRGKNIKKKKLLGWNSINAHHLLIKLVLSFPWLFPNVIMSWIHIRHVSQHFYRYPWQPSSDAREIYIYTYGNASGIHFAFALLGSQWIISIWQALGFQVTQAGYTFAMFRYEPSTDAIQTIMNALRCQTVARFYGFQNVYRQECWWF